MPLVFQDRIYNTDKCTRYNKGVIISVCSIQGKQQFFQQNKSPLIVVKFYILIM